MTDKNTNNPIAGTLLEQELNQLPDTYPQLAMRTNKPGKDIKLDKKLWQSLSMAFPMIMESCYKADRLKASLIYGAKNKEFAYDVFPAPKYPLKPSELEMLHAILGIISEGGELLEMFFNRKNAGKPIDRTNGLEEAGDLQWFMQLLTHSLQSTQEEVMHMNIKKLHERFGDSYSDINGLVRDHEKERELLESIEKEQNENKPK